MVLYRLRKPGYELSFPALESVAATRKQRPQSLGLTPSVRISISGGFKILIAPRLV